MKIEYELIRVKRLARGALQRRLPNANLSLILDVEADSGKEGLIMRINSTGNAEIVEEELRTCGYSIKPMESPDHNFYRHISR